jgi:Peptidase A4 family
VRVRGALRCGSARAREAAATRLREAARTLSVLGGGLIRGISAARPLAAALVLAAALATAMPGSGAGGLTHARLAPVHGTRAAGSVSLNWAGYVVSGATTFTNVAATWTEPHVECDVRHALDASSFWIGLGGANFGSPGLEQTGTAADCVRGEPQYYAWYEILPAPATELSMSIHPGDTISAQVTMAGTTASFALQDVTTGATFTRQLPVRFAAVDSAEWIAEAPSMCRSSGDCRTLPLATFRSVLFTGASVTGDQHTGPLTDPRWRLDAIRLASKSGPVSAAPSVLSPDGSSFSVATHGPRVKVESPAPHQRLPLRLLRGL